jgi:tRNA pseudouridine38-40 synthase
VEYDGSAYCGWQSQAHGRTVQDALEQALASVAGAPLRTVCAGRTDTGVHAVNQVVHFDTRVERPLGAWVRGVNAHLPADVAVAWAVPVTEDFHARFSARARRYRYLLLNRPVRPALGAGRVGWHHAPLAVAPMQSAAAALIGQHDFSAFRAAECQAKSPIKTLYQLDIHRQGELITFDLHANAFLHHMVRNIVGALIYVGDGRRQPDWVGQLLAGGDRRQAAPTFAAAGLYFIGADYEERWNLPRPGLIMGASPHSPTRPWPEPE